MIYLDNAATSYPKPESVYRAADEFLRQHGANPGRGGHKMAVAAGEVVHETRRRLAKLFHIADPSRIVFTLNATEALNLGLKGLLRDGDHVVTSSIEHNSVTRPLKALETKGVTNTKVHCSSEGWLDPDDVERAITPRTPLIVVLHASNVTGTIQPIEEIGDIARRHGLVFMVDAAQSAGGLPIDVEKAHIDLLAFPGHKGLLGPPGTGGLYIGEGVNLTPLREGGTGSRSESEIQPESLPDRYESGTLNSVGIASLGAGVAFLLEKGIAEVREHEARLPKRLLEGLAGIKGMRLYGPQDEGKQVGVVSFNIAGWGPQDLSAALDQSFDIAVRAGLHCAPYAHRTIGTFPEGAVRLSLGYFNTLEEINYTLKCIRRLATAA